MGRRVRQAQPVPLLPLLFLILPLLFLILAALGSITGVLQGPTLLPFGGVLGLVLCLVLAYVSYTRREVLGNLFSGLPETPTRLLLILAIVAIVSGVALWSIRQKPIGPFPFGVGPVRVIRPYSSQAVGLVSLGLIAIVVALAARAKAHRS